jgi:hypothetical protein
MKLAPALAFAGLALPIIGFGQEYPAQKINRVDAVRFGQEQVEVERLLGQNARTEESVLNRAGIDYWLLTGAVKIEFDTGKLVGVTFDSDYNFNAPVAMFPEGWRNLDPIGKLRVTRGMGKADFLKYFKAWEARAKEMGAFRTERDELLRNNEYSVHLTSDELMDLIHISFGPERSTGKGGSWGSACTISFTVPQLAALEGKKPSALDSISVLCDDFNTHARHPRVTEENSRPQVK